MDHVAGIHSGTSRDGDLAAMDNGKIDKSQISAWVAPRIVTISNDKVASFAAAAPDRLMGVGSVVIAKPMHAIREIRHCIQELGFKAPFTIDTHKTVH